MTTEPVANEPRELMMKLWKQQLDTALRVIEAATEASEKIREMQLAAAVDAHAGAFATQKTLDSANSVPDLLRIQAEWMLGNAGKSAAYWRRLCEAAVETNADILKCLCEQAQAQPDGEQDPSRIALTEMINAVSRKWLDAAQLFAAAPQAALRPEAMHTT